MIGIGNSLNFPVRQLFKHFSTTSSTSTATLERKANELFLPAIILVAGSSFCP